MDPWIGKIPRGGNGNQLQYSYLENPWTEEPGDHGPWGHKELDTTGQLSMHACREREKDFGSTDE